MSPIIVAFQTVGMKPLVGCEIYVHNFSGTARILVKKNRTEWIYQNISHIVKASVFMWHF